MEKACMYLVHFLTCVVLALSSWKLFDCEDAPLVIRTQLWTDIQDHSCTSYRQELESGMNFSKKYFLKLEGWCAPFWSYILPPAVLESDRALRENLGITDLCIQSSLWVNNYMISQQELWKGVRFPHCLVLPLDEFCAFHLDFLSDNWMWKVFSSNFSSISSITTIASAAASLGTDGVIFNPVQIYSISLAATESSFVKTILASTETLSPEVTLSSAAAKSSSSAATLLTMKSIGLFSQPLNVFVVMLVVMVGKGCGKRCLERSFKKVAALIHFAPCKDTFSLYATFPTVVIGVSSAGVFVAEFLIFNLINYWQDYKVSYVLEIMFLQEFQSVLRILTDPSFTTSSSCFGNFFYT